MPALKIEVPEGRPEAVSGISAKTGKPYSFVRQQVFVFFPESKYPEKTELVFDAEHNCLLPGMYAVDLNEAASVDRFGNLSIDSRKFKFQPVRPAQPAAPAPITAKG